MTSARLQQELGKKHPFDSPEQEALINLLRTNDQFQNQLGRVLRQHGLTTSQYNVLRILRGEGRPMPSLDVARRMIQVVPAITGLIDRLEKQALVRRKRCSIDRRIVHVEITRKALAAIAKLDGPINELHEKLLGHLKRTELKELSRLLEKARVESHDPAA